MHVTDLLDSSKRAYPASPRHTLPLIIALQILLGSAACLYPTIRRFSAQSRKQDAFLLKILEDYIKEELAKSKVRSKNPYQIHI